MGCGVSTAGGDNEKSGLPGPLVFTPGQRSLIGCHWQDVLSGRVSPHMTNRLLDARLRLASAIGTVNKREPPAEGGGGQQKKKKAAALKGKPKDPVAIAKFAEEYLPLLLGLTKEGGSLSDIVEFSWTNEEDNAFETALKSAHYELVSVLHVLGVATLEQANTALLPKPAYEGAAPKVTKDARKSAVDLLLRAAGIFDAAITSLAAASNIKSEVPADIKEGTLQALKFQALAQAAEEQIEIAEDEVKPLLDSKRLLSTEAKQHWQQAASSIAGVEVAPGWGEKHKAFLRWKLTDASAVSFYYFGLVLDEGKEKNTHATAVACLKRAEVLLKEGAIACKDFGMTEPLTRTPPPVGPLAYLTEKIPRDAMSKARINKDVYYMEKEPEKAPTPPDVTPSLVPTPYNLPPVDPAWLTDIPGPKPPPPSGGAKIQEPPSTPGPMSEQEPVRAPESPKKVTAADEGTPAPAETEKVAVNVAV